MMWVFTLINAAVILTAGLFVLRLLRLLRRRGRRDRTAERVIWFVLLYSLARLALLYVWPAAPLWCQIVAALPAPALAAGFVAARVHRHPEVVLSPTAIRRWQAARDQARRALRIRN